MVRGTLIVRARQELKLKSRRRKKRRRLRKLRSSKKSLSTLMRMKRR